MSVKKIDIKDLHKINGFEKQISFNHCGRVIDIMNFDDENGVIMYDVCVTYSKSVLHFPNHHDLASLLYTVFEEIEKGTI